MSIDLSKLSAKELFELAQQKEQEEQQAAEQNARIEEFTRKREAMLSEHKNILLLTDKKIRDMQEKRDQLVADQEQALAALDREIAALGGVTEKQAPQQAPTEEIKTGQAVKPEATGTPDDDRGKLKSTLRQIMNKRPYISASLLKEKLTAYGIKRENFNQDLEQWVRDGWFVSKGKGNYAMGNKL